MKKFKDHVKKNADNIKAVAYAAASLSLITAGTIVIVKRYNEVKEIAGAAITVVEDLGGNVDMIVEELQNR